MRTIIYVAAISALLVSSAYAQDVAPGVTLPARIEPEPDCRAFLREPAQASETSATVVDLRIGEDGVPHDLVARLSSGNQNLDETALRCVAEWRYKPMILFGKAVAADWKAEVPWGAYDAEAQRPILRPNLDSLTPMIHRLAIPDEMDGLLSTALKLTESNERWHCRQVFLDVKDDGDLVRHWIAQGWNDSNDLVYARTDRGHFIAIHVLADGTFVAAVSIDTAAGKGIRLPFARVKELLNFEVAAWNETVKSR